MKESLLWRRTDALQPPAYGNRRSNNVCVDSHSHHSLDQANIGTGGQRPNVARDWRVANSSRDLWYNPAAFALAAQYTFGNAGRNILRGPNFSNLDFSTMKRFLLTEYHHVTFRAEMFNAFNTANFGLPSGGVGTTSAGGSLVQ